MSAGPLPLVGKRETPAPASTDGGSGGEHRQDRETE